VCKVNCGCDGCPTGKQCTTATGKCEDPGCNGASCAAGTHCVAGACVDDCQGAVCPKGQLCSAGQCVVDADAGAGGSGGSSGDGGIVFGGSGGGSAASGGSGAKDGGAFGGTGNLPGTTPAEDDGGCGCRAAGRDRGAALGALALLGLLASRLRRRR